MTRSRRRVKASEGIIGLMLAAGLILSFGCSDDDDDSGGSGDPHVKVFLTSLSYAGNRGGPAGADANCMDLATAAGLPGTWTAWLSDDNTNAVDRIFDGGTSYRLVDGTVIADDLADLLDGTLDAPIGIFENGGAVGGAVQVWSATGTDGTLIPGAGHCANWTSPDPGVRGRIGRADGMDATWTDAGGGDDCDLFNKLYCFADATSD